MLVVYIHLGWSTGSAGGAIAGVAPIAIDTTVYEEEEKPYKPSMEEALAVFSLGPSYDPQQSIHVKVS